MLWNVILIAVGAFVAREADGLLSLVGGLMFIAGALGILWFVGTIIIALFTRDR